MNTEILVSIIVTLLTTSGFWTVFFGGIVKKIEKKSAIHEALGALLRHDMFEIYDEYKDKETVPADVQEEMDALHSAYKSMGLNHLGDKIHAEIMQKKTA